MYIIISFRAFGVKPLPATASLDIETLFSFLIFFCQGNIKEFEKLNLVAALITKNKLTPFRERKYVEHFLNKSMLHHQALMHLNAVCTLEVVRTAPTASIRRRPFKVGNARNLVEIVTPVYLDFNPNRYLADLSSLNSNMTSDLKNSRQPTQHGELKFNENNSSIYRNFM